MTDELKDEVSGHLGDLIEKSMEEISSATVDVWIDSHGLLRRETSTTSSASLGGFTMTMDFSGYGIRPDIQAPPSAQVSDLTPFLEKALDQLADS